MFELANRFPHPIFSSTRIPVVSIYLPTHRTSPDNKQDVLVYKNMIKEVEDKLNLLLSKKEVDTYVTLLQELRVDKDFWIKAHEGVCVFTDGKEVVVYQTQRSVPALAVVSDSFHTKPLRRVMQSSDQYVVLGLARTNFQVYLANRYHIEEIIIENSPRKTLKEALGDQVTEGSLTFGSYGGAKGNAMYHGHGDKSAEIDKDTEKYFKYVDDYMIQMVGKEYAYPVILFGLNEYHATFIEQSKNPLLHKEGVRKSYESVELTELHQSTWSIMEKKYASNIKRIVDTSFDLMSKQLASHDLNEIIKAAIDGRVKELCVNASAMVYGEIDLESARIIHMEKEGLFDDVVDDLIDIVDEHKGKIWVVDRSRLPEGVDVIAIYRY